MVSLGILLEFLLCIYYVTLAARGLEEPCASFPGFCNNRQFPVSSRLCIVLYIKEF